MPKDYDVLLKMAVIGDSGVGKSKLLAFFTSDHARNEHGVANSFLLPSRATVGVEFASKDMLHADGTRIRVQVWDTAGQERYRAIARAHYRNVCASVLVFDVCNRSSFETAVESWFQELSENISDPSFLTCTVLVGNKADLVDDVEVSEEEHREAAERLGVLWARTSAKTGENVVDAFYTSVYKGFELFQEKPTQQTSSGVIDGRALGGGLKMRDAAAAEEEDGAPTPKQDDSCCA